jgi:hypothetical protein
MKGRKKGSSAEASRAGNTRRHGAVQDLIQTVDKLAATGTAVCVANTILRRAAAIPWLDIQNVGSAKFTFTIDRELRNICDWHTRHAHLGGQSHVDFYKTLRAEIKRRREEANYERKSRLRWTPENVITLELCRLIDWIEDELNSINPGQSANGREVALTSRNSAGENNGTKDQLGTCSTYPGTGAESGNDAPPSGGAST